MNDAGWKDRIDSGRERASATVTALTGQARDAAAVARERISEAYGSASRTIVDTGSDLGSKAVTRSRDAVDKAVYASRGLVAERPLTAIAIGLVAGVALGFFANQLVRGQTIEDDDGDDFTGG